MLLSRISLSASLPLSHSPTLPLSLSPSLPLSLFPLSLSLPLSPRPAGTALAPGRALEQDGDPSGTGSGRRARLRTEVPADAAAEGDRPPWPRLRLPVRGPRSMAPCVARAMLASPVKGFQGHLRGRRSAGAPGVSPGVPGVPPGVPGVPGVPGLADSGRGIRERKKNEYN